MPLTLSLKSKTMKKEQKEFKQFLDIWFAIISAILLLIVMQIHFLTKILSYEL